MGEPIFIQSAQVFMWIKHMNEEKRPSGPVLNRSSETSILDKVELLVRVLLEVLQGQRMSG